LRLSYLKRPLFLALLAYAALLALLHSRGAFTTPADGDVSFLGPQEDVRLSGRVLSMPALKGDDHEFVLGIESAQGSPARGRVLARVPRSALLLASAGEEAAMSLGVSLERLKRGLLALAALVTGTAVSVSGTIGFVGLLVPHAVRLTLGPDHRLVLPASFLAGAIFLIWADLIARTVWATEELRLGVVTAAVGAPFFLVLLERHRSRLQ